jgi:hypothetical protein
MDSDRDLPKGAQAGIVVRVFMKRPFRYFDISIFDISTFRYSYTSVFPHFDMPTFRYSDISIFRHFVLAQSQP